MVWLPGRGITNPGWKLVPLSLWFQNKLRPQLLIKTFIPCLSEVCYIEMLIQRETRNNFFCKNYKNNLWSCALLLLSNQIKYYNPYRSRSGSSFGKIAWDYYGIEENIISQKIKIKIWNKRDCDITYKTYPD